MRKMVLIMLAFAGSVQCAILENNLKDLKVNLQHLLKQLTTRAEGPPPLPPRPELTLAMGYLIIPEDKPLEEVKATAREILQRFVRTNKGFLNSDPNSYSDVKVLEGKFQKVGNSLNQVNPHDTLYVFEQLLELLGINKERRANYFKLIKLYLQLLYLKGLGEDGSFNNDSLNPQEQYDFNYLWNILTGFNKEDWAYQAQFVAKLAAGRPFPSLPHELKSEEKKLKEEIGGEITLENLADRVEKQQKELEEVIDESAGRGLSEEELKKITARQQDLTQSIVMERSMMDSMMGSMFGMASKLIEVPSTKSGRELNSLQADLKPLKERLKGLGIDLDSIDLQDSEFYSKVTGILGDDTLFPEIRDKFQAIAEPYVRDFMNRYGRLMKGDYNRRIAFTSEEAKLLAPYAKILQRIEEKRFTHRVGSEFSPFINNWNDFHPRTTTAHIYAKDLLGELALQKHGEELRGEDEGSEWDDEGEEER